MNDQSPSEVNGILALREKLMLCAALSESESLERQRQAIFSALFAVTDYLDSQNFPPSTLLPIMRPAIALAELQDNIVDPLFAQRSRDGRPKTSIDDHERTGILAAFANAWLRLHRSDPLGQREKLSAAARAMRGDRFGKVDRAKLKSARDMVSQGSKGSEAAMVAMEFERLFDDAIELVGPGRAFQFMVDFVNRMPAARLPKNL